VNHAASGMLLAGGWFMLPLAGAATSANADAAPGAFASRDICICMCMRMCMQMCTDPACAGCAAEFECGTCVEKGGEGSWVEDGGVSV